MPGLWYVDAPRPTGWGADGARHLLAREPRKVWCALTEEPDRYASVPSHEFPLLAVFSPLHQVAEIVHLLAPDAEPGLITRLVDPDGPAAATVAGYEPVGVRIGGDLFLGLALRGTAHTMFTAAVGRHWVSGIWPDLAATVVLEPAREVYEVSSPG